MGSPSFMDLTSSVPRYDPGLSTATFGVQVYKQMALSAGNDNIIASPFGIALAILLAYAGAEGRSKSEIESALKMQGYSKDQILQGYGYTMKLLSELKGANAPYRLDLANNAYVDKKFPLKSQYVKDIQKYLGVTPSAEDFQGNPEAVRNKINKWAENATENKIQEPLKSGTITPDTALVLVNAIYFKSKWQDEFEKSDTESVQFNSLNGQKSQIQMMYRSARFSYSHNEEAGYQFISIPYKNNRNSLMIIMPDADRDFKQFEQSLTASTFVDAAKGSKVEMVKLGLPKFKFDKEYDLQGILSNLGMASIFTSQADFSSISQIPLQVSKAIHKAFIDTNEEGTEAAAVTALVAVPESLMIPPEGIPEMICDRPFIFAIRNEDNGLLIFNGRVSSL